MALSERLVLRARWPGEVVGAELVLGIHALLAEVLGPLGEQRPVLLGEVGVPFGLGDGGGQDDHVAALLHRHLVLLGPLAAAVDLAVGQRILADVVRREGQAPARQAGVLEDERQHALGQRRVQQQKNGARRIGDVHGADAAVGEILLGEEERRAVDVGHQFVRGQGLAVGQDGDLGVLAGRRRAPGPRSVPRRTAGTFGQRGYSAAAAEAVPRRSRRCAATRAAGCAGSTGSKTDHRRPASPGG